MTKWTVIARSGMRFELDRYEVYQRKTKRHAWILVNLWDRIQTRRNTMEKPHIPIDVEYSIRKLICCEIEFV